MIGIFEKKKRTAAELVTQTRQLLLQLDATSWDSKQDDNKVELAKNIREMKCILYGSTEADPNPEMCVQLSQEVFKDNAIRLLIQAIPRVDLEARKDITQVVANLQRQQVNSRRIAADYLAKNTDLLDLMVLGYENLELALHYGTMLRECIRHQVTAKYVLESDKFVNFFTYVELPNFDIASNAATTFTELLTRHKSAVAEFLTKNYDWFFLKFNKLLESQNYITKWQSVKLLGDILFDRSNVEVMMRYVSCTDNLRILMNLLKEPSKNIQVEAFHVFKIFVANTSKPPEIVTILMANREKLLNLLGEFTVEKEDIQLDQDISHVKREIEGLE